MKYESHKFEVVMFEMTDVFVDDNTPSNGGEGGWDLFSYDKKSDM